jgi:ribonuclease R
MRSRDIASPDIRPEQILGVLRNSRRPLTPRDITLALGLPSGLQKLVSRSLKVLVREDKAVRLHGHRFSLSPGSDLITGTLSCVPSGNGYLIPDSPGEPDVFVPARRLGDAMHGDRVIVRVQGLYRGKREGAVTEVLEKRTHTIVGRLLRDRGILWLEPSDERYVRRFVVQGKPDEESPPDGVLAACRITRYPKRDSEPVCRIAAVFDGLPDVASITRFIHYKYSLPFRFRTHPEPLRDLTVEDHGALRRVDLSRVRHVTIDGEEARDFDDAVAIVREPKGWRLYVSIADVSHFVPQSSALDLQAYERGTSVYFPGTVTPMLPKALSNDICSLKPGEERHTMTVEMLLGKDGRVMETRFYPSTIRSAARLTYRIVEGSLANGIAIPGDGQGDLARDIELMGEIATILKERRLKRGALDFDLPEPDVILDIEGGVSNIVRSERLFAHSIIEEFMIAANEAVASRLQALGLPALFRIHEEPDQENMKSMEMLLKRVGMDRRKSPRGKHAFQDILAKAEGTEIQFYVNRVLLRSLKQARYSAVNRGHFGLASDCYLHFTSPIRRYPDLVCHRALKAHLAGQKPPYPEKELEAMAAHLSQRERLAMDAERELEDRVRILFMKERVGEVFNGIISHVNLRAVYVELSDVFVEGMIPLSDLPGDSFFFEEGRFRVIGRRTRKIYQVGDRIRIKVVFADVEEKRLLFAPLR